MFTFRPTGTKYEKALQWRLPVVNVAWLNEIVLGDLRALKLPVHSRFQQFSAVDPFCLELWRVVHLLGEFDGRKTRSYCSKKCAVYSCILRLVAEYWVD